MAGFFQAGLQATDPKGVSLKDYRHAAKIFGSSGFQNAPKFKWLFHVYFEINRELISNGQFGFPPDYLPGLLVKNINLPKFSVTLAEMNQYNRKRYVQTKLSYDPITVAFHDDNAGSIRDLWYKYFSYNYYDPDQPNGETDVVQAIAKINQKNTYAPNITGIENWGLNGEFLTNSVSDATTQYKAPFFRSIKIYGFNQHSFALYELINPIIERFEHDTYDYAQGSGVMENRMTIKYETVKYQQGALDGQDPTIAVRGFGLDGLYDKQTSPIMVPGANSYILGTAGLVDSLGGGSEELKTLYRNASVPNSVQDVVKNPQSNFNGAQKKLIDGAVNASTNPDTVRSQFNLPSSSSVNGPTAQNGQSNNWPRKSALPIPTPANNPII
jgi:hypothetical protein